MGERRLIQVMLLRKKGCLVLYLLLLTCLSWLLVGCYEEKQYAVSEPIAPELVEETVMDQERQVVSSEEKMTQETTQQEMQIDFKQLLMINPDTVGWLCVPGTKINYPIVQAEDNDKYLYTDFNEEENNAGSIFLDFESPSDLMGKNNIIYGHNMKNGTMFGDLIQFKDETFFNEHRYFQIITPERVIYLKAISCYYGEADVDIRQTTFESQNEYDKFVDRIVNQCPFAEIPNKPVKAIYTFITCSYEVNDARTYLLAIEEG